MLSRVRSVRRRTCLALIVADRKSTRLNSSHSQISYAVFCLKKKKKQSDSPSFQWGEVLLPIRSGIEPIQSSLWVFKTGVQLSGLSLKMRGVCPQHQCCSVDL